MKYIGLDIGGTKCAATVASLDDGIEILDKVKFPTAGLSPMQVMERFYGFIDDCCKRFPLGGIGISCGGPLDSNRGLILSPPSLPQWEEFPIVRLLFDRYAIPTYLQNDANACAVAEWKFGAGKGTQNMVFLTFGTGLGAGLVLNGRLYSGANDNAGEIGHVRLTASGPYGYYKNGSCEGYCSGGGITRLAQQMLRQKKYASMAKNLLHCVGGADKITTKDIADLAKAGDPFCKAVFTKSGKMLGKTLSILTDVLNPELIVIGGVFMRSSELLLPEAQKVMKKECLSYSLNAVRIEKAGLGESVGDYAALAVARGDF